MMIFYLVGTVLPCASGCLCMLPRHESKMDLYSRQRVCTCSSQPYCVTCAPRILIVRIFLILPSVNLWGYINRTLRAQGVSGSIEAFRKDEIDQLWCSGALTTDTPKGLIRAVFFLNGISFCLRGGEEHRGLKLSQFRRESDPPRFVYTELASKNRAGGLAQLRVKCLFLLSLKLEIRAMYTSWICI